MDRALVPPLGRVRVGGQERQDVGMQDEVDRDPEHAAHRQFADAVEFDTKSAHLNHSAQLIGDQVDWRHNADRLHLDRQD